jgi:glutamyl-tRNA reductase
MDRKIRVSGINHHKANISLREAFAVDHDEAPKVLAKVLSKPGVKEAVIVSTCNRVEVVSAFDQFGVRDGFSTHIEDIFSEYSGFKTEEFAGSLYHLKGKEAVAHLFRVSAGINSLVVGEPQILGQLKNAYQVACSQGTTSVLLNKLFHRAFSVAKAIRTHTRIGHNAVSICYAARELARQIFGDLSKASVMLIGVGDTGALALKHFKAAGVNQFFIANKTQARATELAGLVNGISLNLSNFKQFLAQADIVIGACALKRDDSHLLSKDDITNAQKLRPGRPQFYIDLGVPRNFCSSINQVPDAFLYSIDDLKEVVNKNLSSRELEVQRAEALVDLEVEKFCRWLNIHRLEPTIKRLKMQCLTHQNEEVRKTLRRLKHANLTPDQEHIVNQALHALCDSLLAKTLHKPITYLKDSAITNQELEDVFCELFLKDYQ